MTEPQWCEQLAQCWYALVTDLEQRCGKITIVDFTYFADTRRRENAKPLIFLVERQFHFRLFRPLEIRGY